MLKRPQCAILVPGVPPPITTSETLASAVTQSSSSSRAATSATRALPPSTRSITARGGIDVTPFTVRPLPQTPGPAVNPSENFVPQVLDRSNNNVNAYPRRAFAVASVKSLSSSALRRRREAMGDSLSDNIIDVTSQSYQVLDDALAHNTVHTSASVNTTAASSTTVLFNRHHTAGDDHVCLKYAYAWYILTSLIASAALLTAFLWFAIRAGLLSQPHVSVHRGK